MKVGDDFVDYRGRGHGRVISVIEAQGFMIVKVDDDPRPARFLVVRDGRVLDDFPDPTTAYLVGRLVLEGALDEALDTPLECQLRRHVLGRIRRGETLSDAELRWAEGQ